MVGLVLEGGGLKGSYEIGAYYAFKDCHVKFDAVVGTSIGSFNAAMIVAHQEKRLLELWQAADITGILGIPEEYIKEINKNKSKIKQTIAKGQTFAKIFKDGGLTTEGYRKTINENLNEKDLRNSKMDFGLNTVRLKDLKPIYLFKDDIPAGELTDYIIASCHFPFFKLEKLADSNYYIDGGWYDNSPSNMLEEKGYNTIYIVNMGDNSIKQKKINKANIINIYPSKDLGKMLNFNQEQIKYNISLGYYDTIKVLKKYDGYKYIFKVKNKQYYDYLVRKLDKITLERMQNYFITTDNKELILKAIEEILRLEKKEYCHIYDPIMEILRIKRIKKDAKVYKFIKKLSII